MCIRDRDKLAEVSGVEIKHFADVIAALKKRHDFFEEVGCRLSDHGIEEFYAEDYTPAEIESIFDKVYGGKELTAEEIAKFKTAMMVEYAIMDHDSGWTQQFHYGAIRNNNSRMMKQLGPDTGFDSIGDFTVAKKMSKFLDMLASKDKLGKTIIYNLNPRDNEPVSYTHLTFGFSAAVIIDSAPPWLPPVTPAFTPSHSGSEHRKSMLREQPTYTSR